MPRKDISKVDCRLTTAHVERQDASSFRPLSMTEESSSAVVLARRADMKCLATVVQTESEFDALEQTWNELLSASDASVFQTFEWLRTCWTYFGRGRRLHCLVFNFDGQVVGIAPLFRGRTRVPGIRVATCLEFIGRGLSDYVDVIIGPGFETQVLNTFAQYLLTNSYLWEIIDTDGVDERSPLVYALPEIPGHHGFKVFRHPGGVSPQVRLSDGACMPTETYSLRRKLRKLRQGSSVTVEHVRCESDGILSAIETFARVHGQRWKSLGYSSAFDDPLHKEFHVEFSSKFSRRGWVRPSILRVSGTAVAVSYNFHYKNRVYMYHHNAYGPDSVTKCSPGFIIRSIAMTDGIREGMEIFDYLRGDESYKYQEGKTINSKN